MDNIDINDPKILEAIQALIAKCGGAPQSFEGELVTQLIQTSLRLMMEGHDAGQLKLITRSIKEMRYAFRIFNQYKGIRRISIFGSARTPEDHPDYIAAKKFSAQIAETGWMCITGAGNGIMKAGLEGPKKESSFGLSIRLPFETSANSVIEGDPKLISFRYFFTRKLMFMSHSDAAAVFPGGVGTLDELFEILTLIQTGRSNIMPLVLVEGEGGIYWKNWDNYVRNHLLKNGWICAEDTNLYHIATDIQDAVQHVQKFYRRYHSSRYVGDLLVLRLQEPLSAQQVDQLNHQFHRLVESGRMEMSPALKEETDHLQLPRLIFRHTRRDFGLLRLLIDQINNF